MGQGVGMKKHGTCKHFNGVQNETCSRGVSYRVNWPAQPIPCIRLMHKSERGGTYLRPGEKPAETVEMPAAKPCPFYEEPTDGEVQAEREEAEAELQKTFSAIAVAGKWRTKTKPPKDRREVVECPVCKGRLHLYQSSYNGHVHGQCETQGCVSWME